MGGFRATRAISEKLRIALELADLGTEMMRENLRRRTPGASDEEIANGLAKWRRKRPGAEYGDSAGRPGVWPRRH